MLELPKRLDRRVLNAALLAGGRIIAEDARRRAPALVSDDPRRTRGLLRRSIAARATRARAGMTATVTVTVRRPTRRQITKAKQRLIDRGGRADQLRIAQGKLNPGRVDPFYWRFQELEYGAVRHAPRPFLRPAFAAKREAALAAFRVRMAERIVKEAQKLNRGPKR
jgi:HK97 gp10 family phage protein